MTVQYCDACGRVISMKEEKTVVEYHYRYKGKRTVDLCDQCATKADGIFTEQGWRLPQEKP